MPPAADRDIELDEHEDDAFLPNGNSTSRKRRDKGGNVLTRFIPHPIRLFFKTLSTLRLVILLLTTFLVLLGLLTYWNKLSGRFVVVDIPPESIALSRELTRNLSGTAIRDFVLPYAPLVFLDKGDTYFPSDLAAHVANTYPTINFTQIAGAPKNLMLDNLDELNKLGGEDVYLTSTSPLMEIPAFMAGQKPNPKTLQTEGAISSVIIVVEKGSGIVDVFYMYFYSFNDGPAALGHKVGNHLGDWEHNMIRFKSGIPQTVWFSQHDYGVAITYDAVHKIGKRPVSFSARGSHANYPIADSHDLAKDTDKIPSHLVYDHTSQGPLWDPTLSAYYYMYSPTTLAFTPALQGTPTSYLYFEGKWGDQQYGDEVKGQSEFHGFRKWTGGPQGPLFKHLDRKDVCWTSEKECVVLTKI